jgi:hypothetical protein
LQRPTIEDHRRRLRRPPDRQAQQHPKIVDHRLKDLGFQPALGLVLDSAGSFARQPQLAPANAGHPTLRAVRGRVAGIFPHQGQIGRYKRPFIITYITRVCLSFHLLAQLSVSRGYQDSILALSNPKVHNTL